MKRHATILSEQYSLERSLTCARHRAIEHAMFTVMNRTVAVHRFKR